MMTVVQKKIEGLRPFTTLLTLPLHFAVGWLLRKPPPAPFRCKVPLFCAQ